MSNPFLRRDAPVFYNQDRYTAEALYSGTNCIIIGSRVRPGGHPPTQHMHEYSDQMYYITEGEMHVQLGSEVFTAGPDTAVFIPRGTPHHNWNEGDVDEFHFEVIGPPPLPGQALGVPTDSTDAGGRHYQVVPSTEVDDTAWSNTLKMRHMMDRARGSEQLTLNWIEVAPGGSGPTTHVHDFDQFFYILGGEMTVEAALHKFVAKSGELVCLPAGVPHTQYNEGSVPERHLALLTPSPGDSGPFDFGVSLAATGDNI